MTTQSSLQALGRAVARAVSSYAAAVSLPWPIAPHAAIVDSQGEVLATTSAAAAGSIGGAVATLRRFFGDAWSPGDIGVTNDQDAGAPTACDITAVAPVWRDGKPVLWAALRGPVPDCGGWEIGGFSPQAVDRWAEGARFEAAKLVLDGKTRREVTDMLMLNSRTPKLTLRCVRSLAASVSDMAGEAGALLSAASDAGDGAVADALFAPELERIDAAVARSVRRAGKAAAEVTTPFAGLALDPIEVAVVPGNDGLTVTIAAPAIAPRPVTLAPGMGAEIVAAAIAGALDLGTLGTGALARRLRVELPTPSLVAAPLPTPVCLGRATTGAAVFAATIAALADAGIGADGSALWRSYLRVHGGGAAGEAELDPATGKFTPARAAAIRAREAEEAAR
ncbi:MAG: hydantoinase B/oxoprolinase family protein [Candidatus Odyssella sp.]|nr:hydantoinase B/oxoprolinase family protein [Candidatus Odyssella sp.]